MHYARSISDEVKLEHPSTNSYEVKAIIGQRWRALPEGSAEKQCSRKAAAEANRMLRQRQKARFRRAM